MNALPTRKPAGPAPARGTPPLQRSAPVEADLLRLLRAAFGASHLESWGRAARPAVCWQELAVHALTQQGAWRYDPCQGRLAALRARGLRSLPPEACELVYVADFQHLGGHAEEHGVLAGAGVTCIATAVAQACEAHGWRATVQPATVHRRFAALLGLGPAQRVLLVQDVRPRAAAWAH